jgi:cytoskeleton protein RodZ
MVGQARGGGPAPLDSHPVLQGFRHVLHDGKTLVAEGAMSVPATSPSAVGGLLRAARQRHGLSVQDVAVALRIRRPYLDAIEDGRLGALPAPAYAIGFVKSYAAALGLDQEEIARRWRDETGNAAAKKPELAFPAPVPERGIPAGALIVVGLVLAVGLYGGWYYLSGTGQRVADLVPPLPERLARIEPRGEPAAPAAPVFQPGLPGAAQLAAPALPPSPARPAPVAEAPAAVPAQPPSPAAPAPLAAPPVAPVAEPPRAILPPTGPWPTGPAVTAESLLPPRPPAQTVANAASANAAVPAAEAAPPAEPPPAPAQSFGANDESRVLLRARADSWIQVRERGGGAVLFNRVLRPGETYRVPMRPGLLLTTGNAGGLEVVLDGDALPTLGQQGVVRRDLPLEPDALKQAVAALSR